MELRACRQIAKLDFLQHRLTPQRNNNNKKFHLTALSPLLHFPLCGGLLTQQIKLGFWVGQWQENNKRLPTRESAAPRTVRSPDALNKAALLNAHSSRINTCRGYLFLCVVKFKCKYKRRSARNLPSIPFIKPGAVSLLGPPAGWQRGRAHQTERRQRNARIDSRKSKLLYQTHGLPYF